MVTRHDLLTKDVRARFIACDLLRRRVQDLAKKKGNDFIHGFSRRQIIEAEKAASKKISGWNDGVYREIAIEDTIGGAITMLRVFCTLRKEADHLFLDFTGTSPEHGGGLYIAFDLPPKNWSSSCVRLAK